MLSWQVWQRPDIRYSWILISSLNSEIGCLQNGQILFLMSFKMSWPSGVLLNNSLNASETIFFSPFL